jgi:hypothetical protein
VAEWALGRYEEVLQLRQNKSDAREEPLVRTAGEQDIMSWLDNRVARLTWRTAMLLSSVVLENCPGCRGNDECNHVSVKLVPLESTMLPEPCRQFQENKAGVVN